MSPPLAFILDIATEIIGVDPLTDQEIARIYLTLQRADGSTYVFLSKETLNVQDAITKAAALKVELSVT